MKLIATAAMLAAALHGSAAAQESVSEDWVRLYEPHADAEMPYRLMKPYGFDPAKRYPMIVLLHGGGGRGTDHLREGDRDRLDPADHESGAS